MSHLGFRLLHSELASRGDTVVERAFLPWPDLQKKMLREQLPLVSLESFTPLDQFDLIGLSLQFELAFTSVIKFLDLSGIPRRAAERATSTRTYPLILVGGVGTLNPEPLAPFVDCFFMGEADRAIHEIVDCLEQPGLTRREQLRRLSGIEGTYIPVLFDQEPAGSVRIARRYVEDLDQLAVPPVQLVPSCSIIHDRVSIEIQRGCCQGCRFCQAGFVTRPTRQRSADRILEAARELLAATGYQDLSLLSLSAGDHPCLHEILIALIREHGPRRVSVSLPSLRTETMHTEIAEEIRKVRKTSFTLAPEAATDRLRRVINKGNSEEDLLRSTRAVAQAGFTQIKLYFMIGLPTETTQDVEAIADLSVRVQREANRVNKGARITVSVSTFTPKPHTPFQWEAAPTLDETRRKQKLLVSLFPRRIRLKWNDPGQSLIEAVIARADRRIAGVLERIVTEDYIAMDSWTEHFDLARWQQRLAEAHDAGELPDMDTLLGSRDPDGPLPWDHLDMGVTRSYLLGERAAALAASERPDCSDGICDACGVCPEEPLHRLTPDPPRRPPSTAPARGDVDSTATQVRLFFSKTDRARLISHLEMVNTFERAARRARLPLSFSRGYHPKAKLRFTPALPLGAESRCEFLELGLGRSMDPADVQRRLAAQLPVGLTILRAETVQDNILKKITGIRWRLTLPRHAGPAVVAARQELAAGGLVLNRKRAAPRSLSKIILNLEAEGNDVDVSCRFDSGGTVKPSELLDVLFHLDAREQQAVKISREDWLLESTQ